MIDKKDRARGLDPAKRKEKDDARQRKIMANSSDKAARKHARTIKAIENRRVRRTGKVDLTLAEYSEENADALRLSHRCKDRHWGTKNAATHRAHRSEERALLDETAGQTPSGRRRASLIRTGLRNHNEKEE
ncbi:hypothetical protein AAD018_013430 [Aestuariibius insulae]|uniref:hypothetical protein n=1 Tax=Aestuariibius insulae TaxID=2058287 RepID=UPI00345ED9AD